MWKRIHFRQLRNIPIRWRLTLISLAVLTLLLVVLSVVVSLLAEQSLLGNEVDVLHNEAHLAETGIKGRGFNLSRFSEPPVGPPPANFQTNAAELARHLAGPNTNAAILTPDGSVLIPPSTFPFTASAVTLSPITVQQTLAHNQNGSAYVLARDAHGARQIVVLIPLVSNGYTVGILQVSTPTAPIDNFLITLRLLLALGVLVTILLAAAVTFPLVGVALRPLVEIERTTRRIARGDLSERINPPLTKDEIGQLAVSFNSMVARLEDAFHRQKQFVADASHELRTPLTALSGSLEMLLIGADRGETDASRRLAHSMYNEVQRMHRLVEDLLVLTRLDEGKIALRRDTIQVEPVITTICSQAEYLAHGQEIHCDIAPNLPPIQADKDRLQQVLLNIVDNALKFTPASGRVDIIAESDGQGAVLMRVRATGQGIPAEALPHVFDRFYRADPARSRQSRQVGGSGLGLAIAKELLEAQGAAITINSVVGEGTTVTIRFPVGQEIQEYACIRT